MTITPDDLVRREVHYCASQLISDLHGLTCHGSDAELFEQLVSLCSPLPDPEEAAIQDGWQDVTDVNEYPQETQFKHADGSTWACSGWLELCEDHDIDPYECTREVYEHWIVSGWLADKLAEKGEAVDKDICGLTIWGRTTTGQAICMDAVIEEICADLNKARGGVPLHDPEGKMHTAKGLPSTC